MWNLSMRFFQYCNSTSGPMLSASRRICSCSVNTCSIWLCHTLNSVSSFSSSSVFLPAHDPSKARLLLVCRIIADFQGFYTIADVYSNQLANRRRIDDTVGKQMALFAFHALTLLVGRREGPVKTDCLYVSSGDLTGALHDLDCHH